MRSDEMTSGDDGHNIMVMQLGDALCGRYELGDILGSGGMATVHAGTDLRLSRAVAIKLLRPELADNATRKRFEQEARTAAKFAHPNVVSIHDTGEHDGVAFIVMERLPGSTLGDEMRNGPFTPARTLHIGKQVLDALDAAHAAGIVHRDIKPSNVLTCLNDSVKVSDFGIASVSNMTATLTNTALLVGTPAYLAPEQFEGRPASVRSDIYSVGAMLYQALSGRKPFEADTVIALIAVVREAPLIPLHHLRPDVDPEFASVIDRALSRDPSARYSSAAEMRNAFVHSAQPGVGDTTQIIRRNHRPPLNSGTMSHDFTAVIAHQTTLTHVPTTPTSGVHHSRITRNARDYIRNLSRRSLIAGIALGAALIIIIAVVFSTGGGGPTTPVHGSAKTGTVTPSANLPLPLQQSLHTLIESVHQ